jgi:hypothetical protein
MKRVDILHIPVFICAIVCFPIGAPIMFAISGGNGKKSDRFGRDSLVNCALSPPPHVFLLAERHGFGERSCGGRNVFRPYKSRLFWMIWEHFRSPAYVQLSSDHPIPQMNIHLPLFKRNIERWHLVDNTCDILFHFLGEATLHGFDGRMSTGLCV